MAGTASYSPVALPQALPGLPALVYKFDPDALDGSGGLEFLPNIECIGIQMREGPDPGQARFRYRTDVIAAAYGFPIHFEKILSDSQGDGGKANPYVVKTGQRIAVGVPAEWGIAWLFDGFTDLPQLNLSEQGQPVTFTAAGAAIRCFDDILLGCLWRSSATPDSNADDAWVAGEPIRFNPEGEPNRAPIEDEAMGVDEDGNRLPTFIDRNYIQPIEENPFKAEHWTLGDAARYVIALGNPRGGKQGYEKTDPILNPDLDLIQEFLSAHIPKPGIPYDPADFSSYDKKPIIVKDVDVTGLTWPEALDRLIRPHGFRFTFRCDPFFGRPRSYLAFYRVDGGGMTGSRNLGLQPYGQKLNPARTNLQSAQFNRDLRRVVNSYHIFSQPERVETSLVLAPLFKIEVSDSDAANKKKAIKTNSSQLEGPWVRKYRWFGLDEDGEGHWVFSFGAPPDEKIEGDEFEIGKPTSLAKAFGVDSHAIRKRPIAPYPTDNTFQGRVRKPTLHVVMGLSKDKVGPAGPGIWEGPLPEKKRIIAGGWRLLKDRLGIEVTIDNPNSWDTGQVSGANQAPQKLSLIDLLRPGTKLAKVPWLVLTCLVDRDIFEDRIIGRRNASPQPFPIKRMIDGRSRYRRDKINAKQSFVELDSPAARKDDYYLRDDLPDARVFGESQRARTEFAPIAGAFVIPHLTIAYEVGSRISEIKGRNLDLRVNAGVDTGEAPLYPYVVGISYDFEGGQKTTLHLSDRRAEGG